LSAAEHDRRLTRARRLRHAGEFRRVFEKPIKVSSASFTILARSSDNPEPRLGLAIAKRQIRKASARNRIKRLIRESFRYHRNILPGLDLVVMARSSAQEKGNAAIFLEMEELWHKLSKRCESS